MKWNCEKPVVVHNKWIKLKKIQKTPYLLNDEGISYCKINTNNVK